MRTPPGIEARFTAEQEEAVAERVAWASEQEVLRRVRERDHTLWGPEPVEIADRLGWLTAPERSLAQLDAVAAFAEEVRGEGFTDCVLLGMGGSSLAPEVLRQAFGDQERGLRLHVLDSTHPAAVAALDGLPPERTLFAFSSKSGGTLEPRSMHAHFHARVPDGRQWIAITDPGTALEALAREQGFRQIFHGDPEIGGRFSALSPFGIVPAALLGADARTLLERAVAAARAADPWLGCALGALAASGRDKLTLLVDPPLASLGLWLEQLIAESTGKAGVGIVPVAGEPLGPPEAYGDDRAFVHLRDAARPAADAARLDALAAAGHPVLALPFADPLDLGRIFFDWELAVAVACAALGVNAFDQPNVQEAKDLTNATIAAYVRDGRFATEDDAAVDAAEAQAPLAALLDRAGPGTYVATMAYLAPDRGLDAALMRLRTAIRARTGAATTVGYGPRFLHSTGQLHKGGPPSGVFLQLVDDGPAGVEVPGAGYDFAALVRAQAIGDGRALRERGLPFLRVRLGQHPARDLDALAGAVG